MDDHLISNIYAAAVQPDALPHILDELGERFGATSSFLFSSHSAVQPEAVLVAHRLSPETVHDFAHYWHQEDPWALAAARRSMMRRDVVLLSEELLPGRDYASTRYYNDFARKAGIVRMLGSVLFDGDERDASLPFTNLCWYRPGGQEAFTLDDKRQLVNLLPHLQTALAVRYKLQQATIQALPGRRIGHELGIATYLLDPAGRILDRNAHGNTLLSSGVVKAIAERVQGIGRRCAPGFPEALVHAMQTGQAIKLLAQLTNGSLVRSTLTPLPPDHPTYGGLSAIPAVLLMVEMRFPDKGEILRRAAALFGFTMAERDTVAGLLDGKSVQDIADDRHVAMSTARTQIRSVLAKSGFSRQIDLVRALSRFAD